MTEIKFLNKNQGQLVTDIDTLNELREHFSISNPAYKRSNKFAPARIYAITPSGRFELGLCDEITKYLKENRFLYKIDDNLLKKLNVGFENAEIKQYSLTYREHQEKSITEALKKGRGVIIIPTAGGKTLIMASIIESMRLNLKKPNAKALVMVPTLQLVTQTARDFQEYGMSNVTKWSGDNKPDPNATTTVVGNQILLSENTDITTLIDYDLLLIDESHTLRRGNKINKILDIIKTDYRFGFTGTMPSSPIDQWNIIGKIGPVVYEEKTLNLKNKNYVSDFKIIILSLNHKNIPNFKVNTSRPAEQYNLELNYLNNLPNRNDIISRLAVKLKNNTIIMVDHIEHGLNIEKTLNELKEDRPIYFIRGSTDIEEREKIRTLMDSRNDIIVVAISKIFSTGINIPNLHNIIFASTGKAKIKIMQSIGRVLRLHPTKTVANIFDITDNTKYAKIHLKERVKLYDKEKYNYEIKKI